KTAEYLQDPEKVGVLVEDVVAEHLVRCAFGLSNQKQLFDYTNSLFHWRSEKREVDFILRHENGLYTPIECKFQPKTTREDKQGLIDFQKTGQSTAGIIVSKGELGSTEKIVILPVWLFLLLV
ncbi:MAG: DUF4143 domain-containing protein, partial [Nitrososphaerales archaeon]